jgi:hypothetical protein
MTDRPPVAFQRIATQSNVKAKDVRMTDKIATCEPCGFQIRRKTLLRVLNFVCFVFHTSLAILSAMLGRGKPMEVKIYRVKASWDHVGRNGYNYDVVEDFDIRIDVVTSLFFSLSAFFHALWVFFGDIKTADYLLWRNIDRCHCFL